MHHSAPFRSGTGSNPELGGRVGLGFSLVDNLVAHTHKISRICQVLCGEPGTLLPRASLHWRLRWCAINYSV